MKSPPSRSRIHAERLLCRRRVVTATDAYDPYGYYTTTSSTGSAAAALNPYRTAGGLYDRTTNLVKYGQRWYNPTTGRLTQQDSIEHLTNPAQGNRYPYAADNPVNNIDPTGRCSLGETLAGALGIEGGGTILEATAVGEEAIAADVAEAGAAEIGVAGTVAASAALGIVGAAAIIGFSIYTLITCWGAWCSQ